MWGFALSDDGGLTYIPIEEPTGWDEVLFTQKRGPDGDEPWIDGADFVFTSTLTFVGIGARILKLAYDNFYIDADVRIRITYTGCEYQFDGFIDFADYNEKPYCGKACGSEEITVRIYKSGFAQLFANRIDTSVNLGSQVGLDGAAITGKEGKEIKLHSKEIYFLSTLKVNDALSEYVHNYRDIIVGPEDITPPFEIKAAELEETLQPSGFSHFLGLQPLFYSGFSYPPGVSVRNVRIDGRIKFALYYKADGNGSIRHNGQLAVFIEARNVTTDVVSRREFLYQGAFDTANNTGFFIDQPFDYVFSLLADTNIIFRIAWAGERPNVGVSVQLDVENKVVFDPVSFINFSENSIITPSSAKVYTIFEAFSKITESITGVADSFHSDFLSTGCGSSLTITNGLNIRRMLDKELNLFPVTCSFKELFDAVSAIYNMGMRIEKTLTGERVRVEVMGFFYGQDVAQTFDYVPDIEMNPDLTHVYNEFEIGYAKWQTEDVNGLDEFNSKRLYSLPVKNVKKKLTRLCNFIASGYLIEQTRRQQFKEKPTSDYSTDNDMFIICTNKIAVTSSQYEINAAGEPITATYQPGTVSERNETFSNIENLFSPATSYNLRISPARNARYYYPLLKVSLYKKTPMVTFRSGTGNYQMISTNTDICNPGTGAIAENGNLDDSQAGVGIVNALYVPETVEFVVGADSEKGYFSFDDFLQAVANPTLTYLASCGDSDHLGGYIKTLNYRPNKEGGFGEFLLQKK